MQTRNYRLLELNGGLHVTTLLRRLLNKEGKLVNNLRGVTVSSLGNLDSGIAKSIIEFLKPVSYWNLTAISSPWLVTRKGNSMACNLLPRSLKVVAMESTTLFTVGLAQSNSSLLVVTHLIMELALFVVGSPICAVGGLLGSNEKFRRARESPRINLVLPPWIRTSTQAASESENPMVA